MLDIRACSASYGTRTVLDAVTLEVEAGSTEAVLGPSGCGKTTLLTLAAGLKKPSAGEVLLDGSPVGEGDRRVSLILQQYGLFPWFTVRQNVGLGLRIRGVTAAQCERRVLAELDRVKLAEKKDSFPSELSGGQQQRAAIARSLALSPALLLMDEPFSALDALARESLQDLLLALLRERRMAAVIVTHSIEEAVCLGKRVTVMAGEPGTVVARLENPGQGEPGFRSDPRFLAQCSRIRQVLEAHRVL
jgi:NitT/TauT family transport system ATP-binding protein